MKILVASVPAPGHVNPMLAITRILKADGHEVAFHTGASFEARVAASGARFLPLPADADFDPGNPFERAPELKTVPPGFKWLRIALERFFIDNIAAQHHGVQNVLQKFPADVILGDDMFFGLLPMLLGPRLKRPPIALCGTSLLHWPREDGAPNFLGLPPATTIEERDEYLALARDYDEAVDRPAGRHLNKALKALGIGPLAMPLFDSSVGLADAYMQLSVPGFEFPREIPPSVHFVGTPPIIPGQVDLPPWAHELDGSRKVVLVTQGTVANHNLDLLITPTLAALANEPDVLVVATTGGRPTDDISGPVPANARLSSYLPFEWLLPKVDVLVTNGGYGSVNQAMSFGIPLVGAGLTEDKADVNARIAWSGVGINLADNAPTKQALRNAVRTVLDQPNYRQRAAQMKDEYAAIDTPSEILRIVGQLVADQSTSLRSAPMAAGKARRAARQH
ncbi:glycosyltransferase family 1 protein [Bradyrhizobium sp. Arg68]|uniref:glycosyltransferase n=1 Tax=Bradyrhizobium ivorense TaxID=2511166 RepID=UPI001E343F0E|nr:glycosyltransferase [Bradyrhizobium ivorense]MCC8935526.1 glycosyltransferase family 1 protein [Bradyrhizobium ivorense]